MQRSKVYLVQKELGPLRNFIYFVGDPETQKLALVDPGWDAELIWKLSVDAGWKLEAILLTHQHYDHINAVPSLLQKVDVPVFIHPEDVPAVKQQLGEIKQVNTGDRLRLGHLEITFIHTPGHTPGSQCFLVEGNLLTGDTLFVDGVGRTDLPGGSAEELSRSLQKLKKLPDETIVYPGHNYGATPSAQLDGQKKSNPYLK